MYDKGFLTLSEEREENGIRPEITNLNVSI